MKYTDLWDHWIEAHSQQAPSQYAPIQESGDYKARWLNPEDTMAFLNAYDPYDLYTKPNNTNIGMQFDYPTSTINQSWVPQAYSNSTKPKNYALFASQPAQSGLLSAFLHPVISGRLGDYGDIPQNYQRFIPQAIYQHELAHSQDPRINQYNNEGYLMRYGLSGDVASREAPAIKAEDMYWDNLLRRNK